jgi:transcriptional regulator with XRE-family HTH domain
MNELKEKCFTGLANIGAQIFKIRKERRLTQWQLAQLARISQPAISDFERGLRVPHLADIIAIASALDINVLDFIGEKLIGDDEFCRKFYYRFQKLAQLSAPQIAIIIKLTEELIAANDAVRSPPEAA